MFDNLGVAVPQNTASYDPLDPPLPTARGHAEPIGGTTQSAGFSWKESGGVSKAAEMPGWVRDYRAGLASIERARNATRATAQRGELSSIDSMAADDRAVLEAEFEPVAMQHLQQTVQDENEVAFVQNMLNRGASAVKAWEALSNERAQAAARGMKGIGGSRGTSSSDEAFSPRANQIIQEQKTLLELIRNPEIPNDAREQYRARLDQTKRELLEEQGRADAAQASTPAWVAEYQTLEQEAAPLRKDLKHNLIDGEGKKRLEALALQQYTLLTRNSADVDNADALEKFMRGEMNTPYAFVKGNFVELVTEYGVPKLRLLTQKGKDPQHSWGQPARDKDGRQQFVTPSFEDIEEGTQEAAPRVVPEGGVEYLEETAEHPALPLARGVVGAIKDIKSAAQRNRAKALERALRDMDAKLAGGKFPEIERYALEQERNRIVERINRLIKANQ
jgi:hypothetical protein